MALPEHRDAEGATDMIDEPSKRVESTVLI
jgi:hypothetical protein